MMYSVILTEKKKRKLDNWITGGQKKWLKSAPDEQHQNETVVHLHNLITG